MEVQCKCNTACMSTYITLLSTTTQNPGSMNSEPSKVPNVCAEVDRNDHLNRELRISWDHLPCHLQNGANIAHYIIHYNTTSGREVETILTNDHGGINTHCGLSGCSWQCFILPMYLNEIYTFQVAAHSSNGDGQLSDPVYTMPGIQGD